MTGGILRRRAWLPAAIMAVALTVATACSSSSDDEVSPSPSGGALAIDPDSELGLPALIGLEPIIQDETVVLDAEDSPVSTARILNEAACTPGDPEREPCEFELTMDPLPAGIVEGSVLASDVTEVLPAGLLVKVTSVDGSTVTATEATLADAIEQGEFLVEQQFSPADVRTAELAPGVTATWPDSNGGATGTSVNASRELVPSELRLPAGDGNGLAFGFDVEHVELADGVYADGHVGFDVGCGAYGGLTWETYFGVPVYPNGAYFEAKCGVTQDASVTVTASSAATLSTSTEIGTLSLDPITFWVGPVPIVLVPEITVSATASGEVKASMSFGASEHFGAVAGIKYSDGFHLIKDFSFGFDSTATNLDARLTARAGVQVAEGLMLYGLAGPQLTQEIYASLEAKPPGERPIWCLKGGIDAGVALHVDLGIKELNYGPESLYSDDTELGCAENIAPTVRMATSTSTYVLYPASTAQPPEVTAYSDDVEEGAVGITWSEGGTVLGSSTSGQPFSLSMLSPGSHTITVTATDSDGATASTSIAVDARVATPTAQIQVQNASGQWVDASSASGTTGGAVDVRVVSASPIGIQAGQCIGSTWSGSLPVASQQGCDYRISFNQAGTFPMKVTATDGDGNKAEDTITITVTQPAPGSPPSFTPISAKNTSVSPQTPLCDGCAIDWGEQVTLQTWYTNWAQAQKSVVYVWEVKKSSSSSAGTWTALPGTDGTPNSSSIRTWTAPTEYKVQYTFTFRVTAKDATTGTVYYTDTFALTYSGPPA